MSARDEHAADKLPRLPVDVDEIAAAWLAQREDGFTAEQAAEFARWCASNPGHAAAVARLEQACALLEKMPLVRDELQPVIPFTDCQPDARRARRRPWTWAVIAAGCAAAAAVVLVGGLGGDRSDPTPARLRYETLAGGYERVTLADGSVLELNASSEAHVQFSATERRVTLAAGEAHFNVARDRAKPFVVVAGGVAVRAVGTAFNVRFAPTAVEVLVTHGKVQVRRDGAPEPSAAEERAASPFLEAGERAVLSLQDQAAPLVEKIEPVAIRHALSWQERKLVFSDTLRIRLPARLAKCCSSIGAIACSWRSAMPNSRPSRSAGRLRPTTSTPSCVCWKAAATSWRSPPARSRLSCARCAEPNPGKSKAES